MDIKIVFHPSGDWEGLYIDGYLEHEGHNTSVEDLVNALNTQSTSIIEQFERFYYDTRDLGNEEGFDAEDFNFPLKYEDIKA